MNQITPRSRQQSGEYASVDQIQQIGSDIGAIGKQLKVDGKVDFKVWTNLKKNLECSDCSFEGVHFFYKTQEAANRVFAVLSLIHGTEIVKTATPKNTGVVIWNVADRFATLNDVILALPENGNTIKYPGTNKVIEFSGQ